jgi:hypothetical protein
MLYLSKRIVLVSIVLVLAIGNLSAQQEFPRCAYWVREIDYFYRAVDLGLNRLHYPGGDNPELPNKNDQIDALNEARGLGLKVVLARAASDDPGFVNCLENFCRFFWTNWEVDSSNFEQGIGFRVIDRDAQGKDAWKVSYEMAPGMIVEGPTRPTAGRRGPPYCDNFTVFFRLKIGQLIPSASVCHLKVFDDYYYPPVELLSKELKCDDFAQAGEYYKFEYTIPVHARCKLYYEIHYYGNVDLWCDFIETKCPDIDDLCDGVYEEDIRDIISHYKDHPAFDRFYLLDEPDVGDLTANRYVMDLIKDMGEQGVQASWHRQDTTFYENYIDSVQANDLLIDYYPIQDITPLSGPEFQERLDFLCKWLDLGRTVAKCHNVPLSYMCQAFGWYDAPTPESEPNCMIHRLPTFSELRCMVWLALAYGAKGIWYFIYETTPSGGGWYFWGLLNLDGTPREPIWSSAKEMNNILKCAAEGGIGDLLLELTSDTTFASYDIPASSYIAHVSDDDTMQIGIFHDDNQEIEYFMMANRHCWPEEPDPPRQVTVGIDRTNIYLKDVYTDEIIEPNYGPGDPLIFYIAFEPGQGRLFQIMHGKGRGGPQSLANDCLPHTTGLYQIIASLIRQRVDIGYTLAKLTPVRLEILNILGQKMETLVDAVQEPGYYSTTWLCGHPLPNGVYFLRFEAGDVVEVKKMVLVK